MISNCKKKSPSAKTVYMLNRIYDQPFQKIFAFGENRIYARPYMNTLI